MESAKFWSLRIGGKTPKIGDILAESHLTRRLLAGMLRKIAALPSLVG